MTAGVIPQTPTNIHRARSTESIDRHFLRAQSAFDHLLTKIDDEGSRNQLIDARKKLDELVDAEFKELVLSTGVKPHPRLYRKDYHQAVINIYGDPNIGENSQHPINIIRSILVKNKIAVALLDGDWEVDRGPEEHSRALGLVSEESMMQSITEWQTQNGILSSEKKVALSLGAGNGHNITTLQKSNSPATTGTTAADGSGVSSPQDTVSIGENWDFVGVCDRYYFPLTKLLFSFLRDNDSVHQGFVRCIVSLIQIGIQDGEIDKKYLHEGTSNLNISLLPQLFTDPSFSSYIFTKLSKNGDDYNYDTDADYADRSKKCRVNAAIIDQFIENQDQTIQGIFSDTLTPDNLESHAPFHFRNIYTSDFTKLNEVFPEGDLFDYGSSVRGTSHIDNEDYQSVLEYSVAKLKPGGRYIDEGVRRSYSREIRLEEVKNTLKKLNHNGEQYRVYIIQDSQKNIVSVMFEKGIEKDGGYIFCRDPFSGNKREGFTYNQLDPSTHTRELLSETERRIDMVMRMILSPYRKTDNYFPLLQRIHPIVNQLHSTKLISSGKVRALRGRVKSIADTLTGNTI